MPTLLYYHYIYIYVYIITTQNTIIINDLWSNYNYVCSLYNVHDKCLKCKCLLTRNLQAEKILQKDGSVFVRFNQNFSNKMSTTQAIFLDEFCKVKNMPYFCINQFSINYDWDNLLLYNICFNKYQVFIYSINKTDNNSSMVETYIIST